MTAPLPRVAAPGLAASFVDALLAEQRAGTAADLFSNWHLLHQPSSREQSYRRLLPLALPKAGQQYAFEVDLDKCSGCKACVVACHSLNGLDEGETWRSVGLLVGPPAVQQHVTTACHHCLDPGCLNGCPVLAYDKDPITGVVRHLDDQCIGCQYCIMKCPYEVPQYSARLGIVRKCDMCHHRLAGGEAPACAQACPSEAIRITIVDQESVAANSRTRSEFLPDSPSPSLTLPTTKFRSSSPLLSSLKAADHSFLRLEPPHWPLVVMLLLSQTAAGLFLAASLPGTPRFVVWPLAATALGSLAVGMLAASLHLGRPLKAWRAFMGWRTSWLSRELIALNAFAAASMVACWARDRLGPGPVICAVFMGALSVFASAMVYIDTGRPAWSARNTLADFFGSTLVIGAALVAVLAGLAGEPSRSAPFLGLAVGIRVARFIWRELERRATLRDRLNPVYLNARVVCELLRWTGRADALLLLLLIFASLLFFGNSVADRTKWAVLATAAIFATELISRYVFFVASASKRMPGGISA